MGRNQGENEGLTMEVQREKEGGRERSVKVEDEYVGKWTVTAVKTLDHGPQQSAMDRRGRHGRTVVAVGC